MHALHRILALSVLALGAALPLGAVAQPAAQPAEAAAAVPLTDGEIRKIDPETGKLTIRHGEIKNLEMPAMTMVFTAKDKAMLDGLKAGDKVKFAVIREDGRMVVIRIEPAP